MQIDRTVEPGGEFVLLTKEHKAGMPPWQILDEQIDVACRCEVIPQDGAEECQPPDASLAAEVGDFFRVQSNGQNGG